jgi:hypothetical protein
MDNERRISELQKGIKTIEWDLSLITNTESKFKKEAMLKQLRDELCTLRKAS